MNNNEILLLKLGEVVLKGLNRRYLRRGPAHDPGGLRRGTQPFFRLAER